MRGPFLLLRLSLSGSSSPARFLLLFPAFSYFLLLSPVFSDLTADLFACSCLLLVPSRLSCPVLPALSSRDSSIVQILKVMSSVTGKGSQWRLVTAFVLLLALILGHVNGEITIGGEPLGFIFSLRVTLSQPSSFFFFSQPGEHPKC